MTPVTRFGRLGFVLVVLATVFAARAATAQTETQVSFDLAGRINALTPPLVDRLGLSGPEWPVTGQFERARLFEISGGGFVVVVERRAGVVERIPLTGEQAGALRSAVAARATGGGKGRVGAQTSVISEPAGSAFVRNQTALGTTLYGISAATMVSGENSDGSTELVVYSLVAGGTTFAALARRRANPPITVAQNKLSTSMALGGGALGAAVPFILGADDGSAYGGGVFFGSIGGTILGLGLGRRMTDAEAAASGLGAMLATGTAFGVMAASGLLEDKSDDEMKLPIAVAAASMIGGFAAGPRYPRRARYNVTSGDVGAVGTSTALGLAAAGIPFIDGGNDEQTVAMALTGGMLAGALLGDRWLARTRDHTEGEARLLGTGVGAGALLFGGLASSGEASPRVGYAMTVAGGILGFIATEAFLDPAREGEIREASRRPLPTRTGSVRGVTIDVDPVGAAFALSRQSGTFSVVRMTF